MELLDTSGLKCPLPVLKAKKALKSMPGGAELKVISTDPGSMKDFRHFCEASGDTLASAEAGDGTFTYVIRKAG